MGKEVSENMISHTDCIEVYGFGSFFRGDQIYRDIDILLIHEDLTPTSCEKVIKCKHELLKMHENAHITLLSREEEKSFAFILRSQSKYLGRVCNASLFQDIEKISREICKAIESFLQKNTAVN